MAEHISVRSSRPGDDGVNKAPTDYITTGEHLEESVTEQADLELRSYLIARHGTADLNPLPSQDPSDPLNWSSWKVKVLNPLA